MLIQRLIQHFVKFCFEQSIMVSLGELFFWSPTLFLQLRASTFPIKTLQTFGRHMSRQFCDFAVKPFSPRSPDADTVVLRTRSDMTAHAPAPTALLHFHACTYPHSNFVVVVVINGASRRTFSHAQRTKLYKDAHSRGHIRGFQTSS